VAYLFIIYLSCIAQSIMSILLLLIFLKIEVATFHLAADLKRGKYILSQEHGVGLYKEDRPYKLSVFDKYARMNLSGFAFSKKQSGKYTISSWKQKGKRKLEIYQVETKLHANSDAIIHLNAKMPSNARKEKIKVNADFTYRTYIINDNTKPQLVFTIATKGETLSYRIGQHTVSPMYESIPIGLVEPDEDEIIRLVHSRQQAF